MPREADADLYPRARLPALYSDFQSQRTLNPDGYEANVSAWRRALALIAKSGLAPAPKATSPSLLVLHCDQALLRALESKQYGQPLALAAVVREALSAKDLIPLPEFLAAKESIYRRPWSLWNVAGWALRQAGVADLLRSDALPKGQFVVVANVEEAALTFGDKNVGQMQSRFERTFSKAHFYKTFADQIVDGKQLSDVDLDVLLRFLSRDKGAILYDGKTIKIKAPGTSETVLTEEDASIAQLKELLQYLHHQTGVLGKRVDELTAAAKEAVAKKNRIAALAALKSKKAAETTLAQRYQTTHQLEEVAARIEQASDNVQLVAVMEASEAALRGLNARTPGGAEGVEQVVDRLREQMEATDEVATILAESAAPGVVDEAEIDDELAALEGEEKAKLDEEERKRKEAEEEKAAEETRKRLEAGPETESEKQQPQADSVDAVAEGISTMSLGQEKQPETAS
jgi:charged multivesicular body protein 7